eukprot:scaffold16470_cov120-Isochrysis_galbana.AAC.1
MRVAPLPLRQVPRRCRDRASTARQTHAPPRQSPTPRCNQCRTHRVPRTSRDGRPASAHPLGPRSRGKREPGGTSSTSRSCRTGTATCATRRRPARLPARRRSLGPEQDPLASPP